MKKILGIVVILIVTLSLISCRSRNETIQTMISSYQQIDHVETINETSYDDGDMFGDAYYVIGVTDVSLQVVHHYMGEYISISMRFGELTDADTLVIEEITIVYCDYEKEIFLTSTAMSEEDAYVKDGMNYQTFFNLVENLSIQDLRYVLEQIELL